MLRSSHSYHEAASRLVTIYYLACLMRRFVRKDDEGQNKNKADAISENSECTCKGGSPLTFSVFRGVDVYGNIRLPAEFTLFVGGRGPEGEGGGNAAGAEGVPRAARLRRKRVRTHLGRQRTVGRQLASLPVGTFSLPARPPSSRKVKTRHQVGTGDSLSRAQTSVLCGNLYRK